MRKTVEIPVYATVKLCSANSRTARTCSRPRPGNPQEIVNTGSVFKILEKSLYWHARAFEQPHTADFPRNALNSRTLIPIEHCWSIAVLVWSNKDQNYRMRDWPYDRRLQRVAATSQIGVDIGQVRC